MLQVVSIVPAIQYVAVDYRGEGRHLVSSTISSWPCLILYASLVCSYRFYLWISVAVVFDRVGANVRHCHPLPFIGPTTTDPIRRVEATKCLPRYLPKRKRTEMEGGFSALYHQSLVLQTVLGWRTCTNTTERRWMHEACLKLFTSSGPWGRLSGQVRKWAPYFIEVLITYATSDGHNRCQIQTSPHLSRARFICGVGS